MEHLPDQLPDGYIYAFDVSPEEIIHLRTSSDWGTETNKELWQSVIDDSIATVGVRDEAEALASVGFLAGNLRHAVLCDFLVGPEHRGKGIGRAVLNRRMNIASELSIPYLYTELAPTNNLRTYYQELGFVATGHAYIWAARRHPREQAELEE